MQNHEFQTGWLSPTGELVACATYEHVSVARDLCEALHLSTMGRIPDDEQLLKHGWCQISTVCEPGMGTAYSIFWYCHLSPEQCRCLKPIIEGEDVPVSKGTQMRLRYEFQ